MYDLGRSIQRRWRGFRYRLRHLGICEVSVKAGKKIAARLNSRIADYTKLLETRSDSKVAQRKSTGGFTRPGSRKK